MEDDAGLSTGPDFSRVRRALLLQGEPDRVPLADLHVDPQVKSVVLGRPVADLRDEVEFWVTAGYDYVPLPVGLIDWFGLAAGAGLGPDAGVSKAIAPPTQVHGCRSWLYREAAAIRTPQELEHFPWPRPEAFDYSPFRRVATYMPSGMKCIAIVGHVFVSALSVLSLEGLAVALATSPDLVEATFEKVGSVQYSVLDIVTGFDSVGAVWNPDDMASSRALMVSPAVLKRQVFPWYRRMAALSQERGKPFVFHSDGDISQILEDLVDAGVNAIHPLDPAAMEAGQIKREYGSRLCLIGGINPHVLSQGAPEDVVREVRHKIGELGPAGGYCLGAGGDVYGQNIPNYNIMREALFRYGRYPLSV